METRAKDFAAAAEALRRRADALKDCRECGLCAGRTQVVFGVGSPVAELMFVGEGPGFHEDRLGEPFVGQAGRLLTELLAGIGLTRGDVYIANVVKCRPPENRDPLPEEIEACSPHLYDQIRAIQPSVICTLGRFATKLLAGTELSMSAVHGKAKTVELDGAPSIVFPVFHPAAALYTPANRRVLEEDFKRLQVLLERGAECLEEPAVSRATGLFDDSADLPSGATGSVRPPRASSSETEQLALW